MTAPFFIVSLPRSRTAWFAVATSTAKSVCYHEPTACLSSFAELVSLWTADAGMSIGVSDSGLALQLGRILRVVKPRTLMIRRPIGDVVDSFRAYMPGLDYERGRRFLEECDEALSKSADHPLVRHVEFSKLDDPEVLSDCLSWLLPSADFPDAKFLSRMNVQVRRSYVADMVARPHNAWHLVP